ncbi:MAG: hypothetical protein ACTHJM_16175 [Marmoricola sp.]
MSRDALESLTREQLIDLAVALDQRNRQAVHRIALDWDHGTFNKAAVMRILKGEHEHHIAPPAGPVDISARASVAHELDRA